jgi:hypothetical protein
LIAVRLEPARLIVIEDIDADAPVAIDRAADRAARAVARVVAYTAGKAVFAVMPVPMRRS